SYPSCNLNFSNLGKLCRQRLYATKPSESKEGTQFEDMEGSLQQKWEELKAESRLKWEHAKQAIKDAWDDI
ncbi:hypothetical protein ABTO96_13860, partial [Acinetobacter baumannii]